MLCQSASELENLVEMAKPIAKEGKVADYIPALSKVDGELLSVSLFYPDGCSYTAGDGNLILTLQSISKVITLALALMDRGEDYVFERVGQEPTGDPFNSIAKLETINPSKPLNPMINAGALAITSMIGGKNGTERINRILHFIHELTGNCDLTYNSEVARSEFDTSHLNRALCYFMKQSSIINEDVEELMELYSKQCAIEMDCLSLAKMGCVFANNGIDPSSGRQLIPADISRICKTFMVTCGMYNASGEFAIKVGIPAKSGVSGGIMGAIPGKCGIGIFGAALDEKGNSLAGVKLLELMSRKYSLSMF
ncbi:glutaminase [Peribacillus deserti]|uniref:Glutaminase n=1 Tax=Peribacillus deserti TaxID=673318 RepID=A0ABS2QHV8_9BACI|nr:glutaminase A [Peribacillus deserti]MBM7692713.1 glutaminase [Peribacillus deserti]